MVGMSVRVQIGAIAVALAAGVLYEPAEAGVRRRLTVRSIPEGALVYVDDQQIGSTPVSTSFVYYGTRKIQLIKDGFKTLTVKQSFSPPWYEIPGVDFFSENLYPGELRDERVLDFQMEPETIPPTTELLQRAEALRSSARSGPISASTAVPTVTGGALPPPAAGAPGVYLIPPQARPVVPEVVPAPQRLPDPSMTQEPPRGAYPLPAIPPPRDVRPLPPP